MLVFLKNVVCQKFIGDSILDILSLGSTTFIRNTEDKISISIGYVFNKNYLKNLFVLSGFEDVGMK